MSTMCIILFILLFLCLLFVFIFFFFSSRRRHTRCGRDWSSDVCSSDLTVIEADDEVFFVAAREDIKRMILQLRHERDEDEYRRIMIIGGGNIGYKLAKAIEHDYMVKIIEFNEERAQYLSENLERTVVLHGSGADKELLEEENIETTDMYCALTNDDEMNIMSSLLAKRLGARKVMSLINKSAYVELVNGGMIDIAISPPQVTIGSLLTHIRRGDIVKVHSLRRGAA